MRFFKPILVAVAALMAGAAMPAFADIPIAVVGPMTGQYAAFGAQMKAGAEMAVEDLNKKGGVLGQKLVLEIGDDACDPKQAVAVANQVASKGVKLVAGHFCSGSSIPASDVYAEEGVIQISPASTNPKLTEAGKANVFRTCGRDDQQGSVAGNYIADHFGKEKIAIVHDKQAYSKGLADETKKQLNARGIQEVMYETITPGEKDYSALVSKLKQAGVEILYYGGYHTEAGLIVRQMREQGMSTKLISGDALVTEEYWGITGPLGEGTMMTFSPDPRKNPAAAPVVAEFRAKGIEPEGYTLYTYGAIEAWAQAVGDAKGTDTKKVIDALHSKSFDTVLGTISFDEKGDVKAPGYVFYVWKDGKYDYAQ
ncbi:MAG: branched-chain amino acid ABC transporter substrate-binding protein [Rhodospirillales bacterium]|nr:branched-chain amino acid ABC transporter substrate-binding protein [Rhodospirillales bacterium]